MLGDECQVDVGGRSRQHDVMAQRCCTDEHESRVIGV